MAKAIVHRCDRCSVILPDQFTLVTISAPGERRRTYELCDGCYDDIAFRLQPLSEERRTEGLTTR